jgi:hypothetical protein
LGAAKKALQLETKRTSHYYFLLDRVAKDISSRSALQRSQTTSGAQYLDAELRSLNILFLSSRVDQRELHRPAQITLVFGTKPSGQSINPILD